LNNLDILTYFGIKLVVTTRKSFGTLNISYTCLKRGLLRTEHYMKTNIF